MPSSLSEFERLFLLEFFVDYVTLQNSAFNYADSSMCVSFQFLHYPVMRVCEEEFTAKRKPSPTEDSKILFKTGKSCLFSVHPDENNKISAAFNLVIAVCQKIKDCDKRILLGQAAVNLGNSFLNLLQSPPNGSSTGGSVKHDLFPLKDKFKRVIGSVAAFARLSNFGKIIITQFQLGAEGDMNYMFKGTDPKKLFKDDPMIDFPIIEKEKPKSFDEGKPKEQPCKPSPIKTVKKESKQERLSEESDESDESETETEVSESEKGSDKQVGDGLVKEQETDENFREIAAEINGHSIIIRVVKKQPPKVETPTVCCCPPLEPPVCQYAPKLNVCECDYPLPPELVPRCPPQCCAQMHPPQQLSGFPSLPEHSSPPEHSNPPPSTIVPALSLSKETAVSQSQEQNTELPALPVCPMEDCPLGLYVPSPPPDPMELEPGCVALKGDQVFFQMINRPAGEPVNEKEKKIASSIYYTVGGAEAGKEAVTNVVQITPQSPVEPLEEGMGVDGPVSGLPLDVKQDMFLFKVLQQKDDVSASCKLEMELRTPKEKVPKPPGSEVETQYLVTDFPPIEKKGKKGKDKGGKKGKKGKK